MKSFLSLLILLACWTAAANAGGVKKSLIGRWTAESGEGPTKVVTTLEFKENGEFTREASLNGRVMKAALQGKWQLTTSVTGVKAVFADPNKLILTYQEVEAAKIVDKTEAWLVIISNDATFGGKETLHLGPVDGGILGTNYYLRAP